MIDLARAKVIHSALLHCYNDRGCVTCPMYDECEGDCTILLREAAEVLATMIHAKMVENAHAGDEKQKPLTWDEAIADDYYLERRGDEHVDVALNVLAASTDGPEPGLGDCICFTTHSEDELKLMRYDYGKTWRCWSRRPTDEERSAAEWITT